MCFEKSQSVTICDTHLPKILTFCDYWLSGGAEVLCLSMILKLFQCCTIVGSPFCPTVSTFRQLDVLFCLLYEYRVFFTVDVLCSLSEAIRSSGFRNITILKLLSRYVTMALAERWWQFGGRMSCKCHAFRAVCEQNFVFCPPAQQHFISLSKTLCLNSYISFKCSWKVLE